jgi:hypothetical protein
MKINNLDILPKVFDFNQKNSKVLFLEKDENNREIFFFNIKNVKITGKSIFYPNILLYSKYDNKLYNPIRENIMSLKKIKKDINFNLENDKIDKICNTPVFYFGYNVDNYYHYLYDTLPYLISFFEIKNKLPNLKLLINYPNKQKSEFYNFVIEFLKILGIEDYLVFDENTLYDDMYISSSYTHDGKSNKPPRKEIYDFFKFIVELVKNKNPYKTLPSKIYISRRTWIHNDYSNIGTNYTTRRKLINEDELVYELEKLGFVEIFTENLSTEEKILLFYNAEIVVSPIGGGIANIVFSNEKTKVYPILSPNFMKINKRFSFIFSNHDTTYFKNTKHEQIGEWKLYMRVINTKNNIIGEIIDIDDETLTVSYLDDFLPGWNNEFNYKKTKFNKSECIKLDNGLNSPWKINIKKLINLIK